ncbi:MAG: hypothetical protein IJT79_02450 [Ruminococcus sp.]|nr:hypothetical protein [Ruminococcus sp.]
MNKKDKTSNKNAEHKEHSAIDIINDLADKALKFTSEKVEQIENKLQ